MDPNKNEVKTITIDNNKHIANFGQAFRAWQAKDAANKLDSQPLVINGLSEEDEQKLRQHLFLNEFEVERKQLGRALTIHGKWHGMAQYYINNTVVSKHVTITSIKKFANVLQEVSLYTGDVFSFDDEEEYDVFLRYKLVEGKVHIQDGIYMDNDWVEIQPPLILERNTIPVVPFKNNAWGEPDVNAECEAALKELNFYGDAIGFNYEIVKDKYLNIKAISGETKEEMAAKIQSGEFVMDAKGSAANIQANSVYVPGNTGSLGTLMSIFNYFEDKVLKYTFGQRETISTGSNKHNLEVATLNQSMFEYLLHKQDLRNLYMTKFIRIIAEDLGLANTENIFVENPLSEIEMMKLQTMKSQVELVNAQAQQALAASQKELSMAGNYDAQATATLAGNGETHD